MLGERHGAEDVGGESLLSVLLLAGLLPEGGGELEDSALGPGGEEAEEVAEVSPGLDAVELAAGEEGDEDRVGTGSLVASEEDPVFSADDLAPEVALGDVVGQRQTAVGEEAGERDALVAGVADRPGDRGGVEDDLGLLVALGEEGVEDRARLLAAHGLELLTRSGLVCALDLEEPLDQRQRVPGAVGIGAEGLEEVPPRMRPTHPTSTMSPEA